MFGICKLIMFSFTESPISLWFCMKKHIFLCLIFVIYHINGSINGTIIKRIWCDWDIEIFRSYDLVWGLKYWLKRLIRDIFIRNTFFSRFNMVLLSIMLCHFFIIRWINQSPYPITEEVRKEPARQVRRGYHMLTLKPKLRRNLFLISPPYDAKRR